MKKKVIICVFVLLILVTAIAFIAMAIDSYRYDMDPKNGVDLFAGVGAVLTVVAGGFVVLYELDLFYTVYYFAIKQKTKAKSILNILSNLCFALIFVCYFLYDGYFIDMKKFDLALLILFSAYLILRMIYFVISLCSATPKI